MHVEKEEENEKEEIDTRGGREGTGLH